MLKGKLINQSTCTVVTVNISVCKSALKGKLINQSACTVVTVHISVKGNQCTCVYVCMYVRMYVCMYVCMCVHVSA